MQQAASIGPAGRTERTNSPPRREKQSTLRCLAADAPGKREPKPETWRNRIFLTAPGAEAHAGAGVQQHHHLRVRFAAIPLQVRALRSREHVPVHMPQIVARCIGAVFRELLAEAEIRRPVQARHEAVHNRFRHQIQAGDLSQNGGIEKAVCELAAGTSCALSARSGLPFEQSPQNLVRIQPVRFGMEIQENPMPQNRHRQRSDVFIRNVEAPVHQRARFSGQHQKLRGRTLPPKFTYFLMKSGASPFPPDASPAPVPPHNARPIPQLASFAPTAEIQNLFCASSRSASGSASSSSGPQPSTHPRQPDNRAPY